MLGQLDPVCFVPVADLDGAQEFYENTLGLRLVRRDEGFALVFDAGGTTLRVVAAGEFTPQPFTIMGWEAPDMDATVDALVERGVEFMRYPHFDLDDRGIWTAPGGSRVAWFKDPDGNVLSLSAEA